MVVRSKVTVTPSPDTIHAGPDQLFHKEVRSVSTYVSHSDALRVVVSCSNEQRTMQ